MTFTTQNGYTITIEAEQQKAIQIFRELYPDLKLNQDENIFLRTSIFPVAPGAICISRAEEVAQLCAENKRD